MEEPLEYPLVDPSQARAGLAAARDMAELADLMRKQATILLVEQLARSVPRAQVVGLHAPAADDAHLKMLPKAGVKVGLFRRERVEQAIEGKLAGVVGGRDVGEQMAELLEPWNGDILKLRSALAPGKFYAFVPVETLAATLAEAIMGEEPARAWICAREVRELSLAALPSAPGAAPGPRL